MNASFVSWLRLAATLLPALSLQYSVRSAVLLADRFDYPDGPLVANSAGRWLNHSGRTNEVDVAGGRANLSQSKTEDLNSSVPGGPYDGAGAVKALYLSFKVRITTVTTATNGAYFALFKDGGNGFRSRIWAVTNGASAGSARIGISSAGNLASDIFPRDLRLGADHVVLVRYDLASAAAKLWVDPGTETDPAAQSTDKQTSIAVAGFALRQNSGLGALNLDDVVVATTFAEALAGPAASGVGGGPVAPVISSHPQSQSVDAGVDVSFSVAATSVEAASYQWLFNGLPMPGETKPTLLLKAVGKPQAGSYSVRVQNSAGITESATASLAVRVEEPPPIEPIAVLRSLIDPVNFLPVDTAKLHTVEGVVTSHVNLGESPGVLFFIQDSTAGIAVHWDGGASQFVPAAGDVVCVTAPLGHSNGLLELLPRADVSRTRVKRMATNQPLPAPKPFEFSLVSDAVRMEAVEGSLVVVSNVFLDPGTKSFASSISVAMTDSAGATFALRVDDGVSEIIGQPIPATAVNITGLVTQSDASNPRKEGYELLVTRLADLQAAPVPPTIRFTNRLSLIRSGDAPTNTFSEHVLLPGEKIVITIEVSDPLGQPVTATPELTGLPATASWTLATLSQSRVAVTMTYTPTTVDSGKLHRFRLNAANSLATSATSWSVYVPSFLEQSVTIGEFLASPAIDPASSYYNPLKRSEPAPAPDVEDQYVELVNLSGLILDFAGWTISDGVQIRHKFSEVVTIGPSDAVVVYGGPLKGSSPNLDVPAVPASEHSSGLGLGGTGEHSILLRNGAGHLVCRVVYTNQNVKGSMTRFPDLDGSFVPQTSVSALATSPGRQYDGRLFSQSGEVPGGPVLVRVLLNPDGSVGLNWDSEPGRTYSVESSSSAAGPYVPVAGSGSGGVFKEPAAETARFYRVRAQ